jgi:hypothetical protein
MLRSHHLHIRQSQYVALSMCSHIPHCRLSRSRAASISLEKYRSVNGRRSIMEPSHQLFGHYLRYRLEKNNHYEHQATPKEECTKRTFLPQTSRARSPFQTLRSGFTLMLKSITLAYTSSSNSGQIRLANKK